MTEAFLKSAVLLIEVLFGLYIFIVLLKLLSGFSRVEHTNPINQVVHKLTQLPLAYVHHFIPRYHGIDFGLLASLYLLELFKHILLLIILTTGTYAYENIYVKIFLWPIASLLNLTLDIYFWGIIFTILFSWLIYFNILNLNASNPLYAFFAKLVNPIVGPFRKFIPPINGIDFTPILVLLFIKILGFFVELIPHPNW